MNKYRYSKNKNFLKLLMKFVYFITRVKNSPLHTVFSFTRKFIKILDFHHQESSVKKLNVIIFVLVFLH